MADTPGSPSFQRRRSSSIFRIARHGDDENRSMLSNGATRKSGSRDAHRQSSDLEMEADELHLDSRRDGVNPAAARRFQDDEDNDNDIDDDDDEETGLTHPERRERRRRRLLHTRFDERIASSSSGEHAPNYTSSAAAAKQIVRHSMLRDLMINGGLIALWYSFSISISVYNKWMFSAENLDFHFPLFTTAAHMVVQFLLASLSLWIFPQFRPRRPDAASSAGEYTQLGTGNTTTDAPPSTTTTTNTTSSSSSPPKRQPLMSRWFYLTRVGPCGTATALDIGLGNFSLRFITLTFFTMCKSSVLAFVLLFAFIFRLEQPTWRLCAVILVMTGGVIMMVAGEAAFNALGFVLVMTASLCSGFRWSLTQILLLRNPATSNPFSSIFFLTPVMFAALFVLAMAIEGPVALAEGFDALAAEHGALYSVVIMLFPGLLAFLMVAAEFTLIKRTSVVTLSVCGIFKEVLTISAASVVFGDPLSPINVSGLVVTLLSIAGYNWLKYSTARGEKREEVHQMLEMDDMSARGGGSGGGAGAEKLRASPGVGALGRDSVDGLMPDHFALDMDDDDDDEQHDSKKVNGVLGNGHAAAFGKRPEHVD